MKLIVVRHATSTLNVKGVLAGWTNNDGLTPEGRREAKAATKKIQKQIGEVPIIRLVSSPLQRAWETAEIIADELKVPREAMFISNPFKERNFGSLEGKTWEEAIEISGQRFLKIIDRAFMYNYTRFGGESRHEVMDRVQNGTILLKNEFGASATIVLVTHGGIIQALRKIYDPENLGEPVPNASIHVFSA